ncbi:cytochrome P450 [Lepidopterella palustris CBS 459.81]|uniref:Cytochrome P450 n=1 Tax=Lepidopterella palustris CBS 459.81 TaxID=1314670 RepID=A0A8E2E0K5_9PEZI|nr:cytochrome P450 [Lepidopterella palustris CBS 459.81]
MVVVAVIALLASYNVGERPYPGFDLVGKNASETSNWPAKKRWMTSARNLVYADISQSQRPFQVIGSSGPLIILPPHFIEEVRKDERMTFSSWIKKDFFTTYPGFEGFRPAADNTIFVNSVRTGLTQSLGHVVGTLADETKLSLKELLPLSNEWQETRFDEAALRIVARLSSRTFLPEPLCHNEEWLRISVNYTVDFFKGAYVLRTFPPIVRFFIHWFLPQTQKLRKEVETARSIIQPELIARRKEQEADSKAGRKSKRYMDAIEWIQQSATTSGEPCDPVVVMLSYTIAAVHTTTITFANMVYNLMSNPEYIDLLREELIAVFNEEPGWTKARLYKLKLMDSCMKESNRLDPASLMTVNRVADEIITLSDGTVIPKGAKLTVPNMRLTDASIYEDPYKFNGRRFYDMRKMPDNESKHQFVTTSENYLPFGHGKHACPGRFFASNEIKVVLAHLLLQYDFKFPDDQGRPKTVEIGLDRGNPKARVLFRARTPEVSLD